MKIKKTTLEKVYLLIFLIVLGMLMGLHMLNLEHDSMNEMQGDSLILKLLTGATFLLAGGYVLHNVRVWTNTKIARYFLWLCLYMMCWRMIDLPFTAGMLSYIYQPMRDLLVLLLFFMGAVLSDRPKPVREFFCMGMLLPMLIVFGLFLQNWQYLNQVDEAHMGSAYMILFFLPCVMLSPQKWVRYVGIVLVVIQLVLSLKRGGLVALGIGCFAYLLCKEVIMKRSMKGIAYLVMGVILMGVVFMIADNAVDGILSQRLMNISDDGGSGRTEVWATTIDMITNSDLQAWIFGHGTNGVLYDSPLGLSAHNDFLEVLYDYGVVGFVPYVLLHLALVGQIFACARSEYLSLPQGQYRAPVMAFAYAIFFVLSMISHVVIYPWMSLVGLNFGLLYKRSIPIPTKSSDEVVSSEHLASIPQQ